MPLKALLDAAGAVEGENGPAKGPVAGFGAAGAKGLAAGFGAAGAKGLVAGLGAAGAKGLAAGLGAAGAKGLATGFCTVGDPKPFTVSARPPNEKAEVVVFMPVGVDGEVTLAGNEALGVAEAVGNEKPEEGAAAVVAGMELATEPKGEVEEVVAKGPNAEVDEAAAAAGMLAPKAVAVAAVGAAEQPNPKAFTADAEEDEAVEDAKLNAEAGVEPKPNAGDEGAARVSGAMEGDEREGEKAGTEAGARPDGTAAAKDGATVDEKDRPG